MSGSLVMLNAIYSVTCQCFAPGLMTPEGLPVAWQMCYAATCPMHRTLRHTSNSVFLCLILGCFVWVCQTYTCIGWELRYMTRSLFWFIHRNGFFFWKESSYCSNCSDLTFDRGMIQTGTFFWDSIHIILDISYVQICLAAFAISGHPRWPEFLPDVHIY